MRYPNKPFVHIENRKIVRAIGQTPSDLESMVKHAHENKILIADSTDLSTMNKE